MSSREHIKSYLDYYLKPDVITDFAVAISGAWGSGKTTFIKKYLEDKNHVYVSLHGLTSVSQIESEIFAQLHPIRNSKTAKVAKKILAGSLKASLKIDLDGDGEADGKVGVGITPEALEKFAEQSDSHVYVFDDIERSLLGESSVSVALGYVNQLTEHLGIKVIVLWNDKVIPDDSLKIAEKTIGQSFTLEANTKLALDDFIDELTCSDRVKKAIREHEEEILLRFDESDTHNLRSLRQAIMDCQRIVESIDERFREKPELIRNILRYAVILKIDQRAGRLERDNLRASTASYFLSIADNEVEDANNKSWEKSASERHGLQLYDLVLSRKTWERIIFDGYIEPSLLTQDLSPLIDGQGTNKKWRELWGFEDLSQATFNTSVSELIDAFMSESHEWEIEDFLQSLGVLLSMAKHGLIELTVDDVEKEALDKIHQMKPGTNLEPIHIPEDVEIEEYIRRNQPLDFEDASEGKAVRGRDDDEYKNLRLELFKRQREAGDLKEKEEASELLHNMHKGELSALSSLSPDRAYQESWLNYPLLRHVNPEKLIRALGRIEQHSAVFEFGRKLNARYMSGAEVLVGELEWLHSLRKAIDSYRKNNSESNKLFVFQLGFMKDRMLGDAITYLEARKQQLEDTN